MKKLLALNRSEIAIRILRAANELGLRTVAIYSQEDRLALHRFKADEAYLVGEGKGPVEAYLDVEGIVALAQRKGRGRDPSRLRISLRESRAARAPASAPGITFIGPSAELLELLGDKTAARATGAEGRHPGRARHRRAGHRSETGRARSRGEIGFPLIIKAAFGGGGRGMRVVEKAADFAGRLEEARREAGAAFGNDAVFLERYRPRARATSKCRSSATGTATSCTSTSATARCSAAIRRWWKSRPRCRSIRRSARALADAAVKLAQAAGYYNAGTVEFLVDADSGEWYFIEVNPRIQVEHTVTEMVTGIDLVRCQIQVAQGLELHGPEMNLPAQDADPALRLRAAVPHHHRGPGQQLRARLRQDLTPTARPAGFGIRLDGGSAYGGAVITPYYDSLLVKMTAWGREFRHACQRMDRGLREFRVRGVKTNIPFLENVVNHPDFQAGQRHHSLAGRDAGAVPLRRRAATAPPSCSPISAT